LIALINTNSTGQILKGEGGARVVRGRQIACVEKAIRESTTGQEGEIEEYGSEGRTKKCNSKFDNA
jgi:hypothetical protein